MDNDGNIDLIASRAAKLEAMYEHDLRKLAIFTVHAEIRLQAAESEVKRLKKLMGPGLHNEQPDEVNYWVGRYRDARNDDHMLQEISNEQTALIKLLERRLASARRLLEGNEHTLRAIQATGYESVEMLVEEILRADEAWRKENTE